jgi:RNA-directed DNA polymerase
MGRVVERDHLCRARKHIQRPGGSPGRDGMSVEALARAHGALGEVEAGVGGRDLPTSTREARRRLEQAVRPVLQVQGEPTGSASRGGFRPGRNAHQAGKRAPSDCKAGDTWGVEMALETVCDWVKHDQVMREVSARVRERRVWTSMMSPIPRSTGWAEFGLAKLSCSPKVLGRRVR